MGEKKYSKSNLKKGTGFKHESVVRGATNYALLRVAANGEPQRKQKNQLLRCMHTEIASNQIARNKPTFLLLPLRNGHRINPVSDQNTTTSPLPSAFKKTSNPSVKRYSKSYIKWHIKWCINDHRSVSTWPSTRGLHHGRWWRDPVPEQGLSDESEAECTRGFPSCHRMLPEHTHSVPR